MKPFGLRLNGFEIDALRYLWTHGELTYSQLRAFLTTQDEKSWVNRWTMKEFKQLSFLTVLFAPWIYPIRPTKRQFRKLVRSLESQGLAYSKQRVLENGEKPSVLYLSSKGDTIAREMFEPHKNDFI